MTSYDTDLTLAVEAVQPLLEAQKKGLPTIGQVTRLHGPLALRNLLNISALKMHILLRAFGYDLRHHQTIYTWERAERPTEDKPLPRRYWLDRYMPTAAAKAYHRIINALVLLISKGRKRARCTGKRIWRISLLKAYG